MLALISPSIIFYLLDFFSRRNLEGNKGLGTLDSIAVFSASRLTALDLDLAILNGTFPSNISALKLVYLYDILFYYPLLIGVTWIVIFTRFTLWCLNMLNTSIFTFLYCVLFSRSLIELLELSTGRRTNLRGCFPPLNASALVTWYGPLLPLFLSYFFSYSPMTIISHLVNWKERGTTG